MTVTVYHNPRCSKSRQTLTLITDRGHEPVIIEYLKQPPSVAELKRIIAMLDITAHDLIRTGEAEYRELGLSRDSSDESLLSAMVNHPRLIERPIMIVGDQARIGRPPESVLEILP
jgi:arsenate reductase (glutaredoxin)